ncbi:hypothetical protein M427DRAFT_136168 [Gonapodya prolifera JEL478]|uniref:RGS domain-containing protein n=1 Tax=Gonapodya prolifera (strain JEL478) TaxID=1344416 RepID=A0A139AB24_GONPJ|nr:hypothetical protein M427DRAFT_136168 [Gonapodya prolifera JEL478]|eukprot:KXS13859.1 hypothetical protein M427DRAFT_136168 [Gonapodya prolifera JEL478]
MLGRAQVLSLWNPMIFIVIWATVVHTTSIGAPLFSYLRDHLVNRGRMKQRHDANESSFWNMIAEGGDRWREFKGFAAKDFCLENVNFVEDMQSLQRLTAQRIREQSAAQFSSTDSASTSTGSFTQLGSRKAKPPSDRTARKKPPFWMGLLPKSAAKTFIPPDLLQRWRKIVAEYIDQNAPFQLNLPHQLTTQVQIAVSRGDARSREVWCRLTLSPAKMKQDVIALDCLDVVLAEVCSILYHNTYLKFVESRAPPSQKLISAGKASSSTRSTRALV